MRDHTRSPVISCGKYTLVLYKNGVPTIANIGSGLKLFEVSKPVETTKGFIIFEVVQRKDPDEEAFKKDKDEYTKSIKERRSNSIMEDYVRKLEGNAKLAINLEEIDKYYK